ncbi:HutD/Ves family protein [Roseovarius aquimarinus]|uniref:HutD family protein n=1 Tax=Roseovarius aquimarinus TaxID=1229156 RepID=A0ABW7I2W3_9RHOB
MQVLKAADLVEVPWKNGGGITRGIARGVVGDRVVWTLSRADVSENGPFSDFAGLRRILTVVEGQGMDLVHEGGALTAAPFVPVSFDGGLAVTSRLHGGPLTDLNLMFDPAACDGRVRPLQSAGSMGLTPPPRGLSAIHVVSGSPEIGGRTCGVADTVFATERVAARLAEGDAFLEIALAPLDQSLDITLVIASR